MQFSTGGRRAIAAFVSASALIAGATALSGTEAAVALASGGKYTNTTYHGGSAPYPIAAATGQSTASGSAGYGGAGYGQNGSYGANQYRRRSEGPHGNELFIDTAGRTPTAVTEEVTAVPLSESLFPVASSFGVSTPGSTVTVKAPTPVVKRGSEPIVNCNASSEPTNGATKITINFWANATDESGFSNSESATLASRLSGSCICQVAISNDGMAGITLSAAEVQRHLSAIESKCGLAATNGDAIDPAYVRVNDDTGEYTIRVGAELTCASQAGTFCVPGSFKPDVSGEGNSPVVLSDDYAQTQMPLKAEFRRREVVSSSSPSSTTGSSVSCAPDTDQVVDNSQVKGWRDEPSIFNNWLSSGNFPLAPSSWDSTVESCIQLVCSDPTSISLCNLGTRDISSYNGRQFSSDLDAVLGACGRSDDARSMTGSGVVLNTTDPEQTYSLAVNITGGCDPGQTESTSAGSKVLARRYKPGQTGVPPPDVKPHPAGPPKIIPAAPTVSIVAGVKVLWASCNQNGDPLTDNLSAVFSSLSASRTDTPTSFPAAGPLLPAIDPAASRDAFNQSCSTIVNACEGLGTQVDLCNNGWEGVTVALQQVLDAIDGILSTCAGGRRPQSGKPLQQINPGIFFNSTTSPQAYYINVFGSPCNGARAKPRDLSVPSGWVLLSPPPDYSG